MKIIVTGATGLLGANFVHVALQKRYNVIGTVCSSRWARPPATMCEMDVRDDHAVRALLKKIRPDAVFHFAAATSVDWCEAHPEEALAINAHASGVVASATREVGARFVYMSTDAVFDGVRGCYNETDTPAPVNVYAASKLEGEREVVRSHPAALIVRANIFGWNALPKQNLAESILSALRKGQEFPGYHDVIFAPVLVNTLAEWMLMLEAKGVCGTIHVASHNPMSKGDFAVELARVFGLRGELVRPTCYAALLPRQGATRPLNTWLSGAIASRCLGLRLPDLPDMIKELQRLEECGFRQQLRDELGGTK